MRKIVWKIRVCLGGMKCAINFMPERNASKLLEINQTKKPRNEKLLIRVCFTFSSLLKHKPEETFRPAIKKKWFLIKYKKIEMGNL